MSSRLLQTQQLIVSGGNPTPTYVLTCADESGLAEWAPAAGGGADIVAGDGIGVTGVNPKTVTNITTLEDAGSQPPNSVSIVATSTPPTYEIKWLREGTNITLTSDATTVTIGSSAPPSALIVENEGVQVTADAAVLDFVGAGVNASASPSSDVTITVPGVVQGNGILVSGAAPSAQTVTANVSFTSAGGDVSLVNPSTDGYTHVVKGLSAGTGMSFTGSDNDQVTLNVLGGAVEILDNGTPLTAAVENIDFTGSGLSASAIGNDVTVTVPGYSAGHGISLGAGPDPITINAVPVGNLSAYYAAGDTVSVSDLAPSSVVRISGTGVVSALSSGGFNIQNDSLVLNLPTTADILADPSFDYLTVGSTWKFYTYNNSFLENFSDRFILPGGPTVTFETGMYHLELSSGWSAPTDQNQLIAERATDEWQVLVTSISPPEFLLVRVSAQPVSFPTAAGTDSPVGNFTMSFPSATATSTSLSIFNPSAGQIISGEGFAYGSANLAFDLSGSADINLAALIFSSGKLTTMLPVYWSTEL